MRYHQRIAVDSEIYFDAKWSAANIWFSGRARIRTAMESFGKDVTRAAHVEMGQKRYGNEGDRPGFNHRASRLAGAQARKTPTSADDNRARGKI
jgi:hypothetical protein